MYVCIHIYVYIMSVSVYRLLGGAVVKNLPGSAGDTRDVSLIPGLG